MKVATVVGARPQFIKAATISRELGKSGVDEIIIHTGQHFDPNMSDVFFTEMEIPRPNYHLEINNLSHGAMTGRMLEKVEEVLIKEKPDVVLVYGDTNSTLAGALAASKLHIPVAHVEAGLRSFDMNMPEEVNRILTDRISKYLFCPTQTAVNNLMKEGFDDFHCSIEQPGDVMYDAVLHYKWKAMEVSDVVKRNGLKPNGFALVTLHRAENTNDPARLRSICGALNEIHKTLPILLPMHPRTKGFLESQHIPMQVNVIDPVGYFDMIALLDNCRLVLTDSGGLQKEAYFFSKYCITLRDQTEWVELVEAGANVLAGANTEKIIQSFGKHQNTSIQTKPLYGSGDAAKKIVASLLNH